MVLILLPIQQQQLPLRLRVTVNEGVLAGMVTLTPGNQVAQPGIENSVKLIGHEVLLERLKECDSNGVQHGVAIQFQSPSIS